MSNSIRNVIFSVLVTMSFAFPFVALYTLRKLEIPFPTEFIFAAICFMMGIPLAASLIWYFNARS